MSYENNVTNPDLPSEFLVEVFPYYEISQQDQTLLSGDVYYIDVSFEDVFKVQTVSNDASVISRGGFDSEDFATQLLVTRTERTSIADVESLGGWFFDKSISRLYFDSINTNEKLYVTYIIRASTNTIRTFKDLTDANSETISWDSSLTEEVSVSRNIADTYTGFFPSLTDSISINPNSFVKDLLTKTDFLNCTINIWHVVGDQDDLTNYQRIFTGFCTDFNFNFNQININVNNGSRLLETRLQHPVASQTFEDLNDLLDYNLSDEETKFVKRKVYGTVSGLRAINVDRYPSNQNFPTNTDNRKWFLSIYDGDNTKISKAQIVGSASPQRFIDAQGAGGSSSGNPFDRFLEISYEFNPALTDDQLLDEIQNMSFAPGDYVVLEIDEIPAEQFYLEIDYVKLERNFGSGGNEFFMLMYFTENIYDKISLQTGLNVATIETYIQDVFDNKTLTRFPISRLYMQDDDGVVHNLEPNIHWNMYQDVTNKFYGVELVSNIESLLNITYGVNHKYRVYIESDTDGDDFDNVGGGNTYANIFRHPLGYDYAFWFNVTDGDLAQSYASADIDVRVDILKADTATTVTTKLYNAMVANFGTAASGDWIPVRTGGTSIEVEAGSVGVAVSSGPVGGGAFGPLWFFDDVVYGYEGLSGNELLVARVYGTRSDNVNFGRDSLFRKPQGGLTNTGLYCTNVLNNNYPSVIYDILNNYLQLDSSDIDIDSFNKVLDYSAGTWDRTEFSDSFKLGIRAGKQFNVNFSIPTSIGEEMPVSRDILIDLLITELWQIYVNRFGKYSIRFINQLEPEKMVTLTENQFDFISDVSYSETDIYGNVFVAHDFIESVLGDGVGSGYSEAVKSSNTKSVALLKSKRDISLNSLNQFCDTTESSKDVYNQTAVPFTGNPNLNTARNTYTNTILSDIFRSNINTFQIELGREFFYIDLGWIVTIDSDLIPTNYVNTNVNYLVIGVRFFADKVILTLSDIINKFDLVDPTDQNEREVI